MSSADIAACFPSEHDSLLGTDVESRRRSSKPFYLTRSSLETRKVHVRDHLRRRIFSTLIFADVSALPPICLGWPHCHLLYGVFFDI